MTVHMQFSVFCCHFHAKCINEYISPEKLSIKRCNKKMEEEKSITVLESLEQMGIRLNKNQLSSLGSRMINRHQRFYLKHGKRGTTIVRLYKNIPQFHEEVLKECKELRFCKR